MLVISKPEFETKTPVSAVLIAPSAEDGGTGTLWFLALASLEAGFLLVDHVDLAAATNDLSARLVLQRPKGLADLHRALLSSSTFLHRQAVQVSRLKPVYAARHKHKR